MTQNDIESLAKFCLADLNTIKAKLEKEKFVSDFDINYEIRLVLFLAAYIDGPFNASEARFQAAIATRMDWSSLYVSLLQGKIDKQPSYDLSQVRLGKLHGALAVSMYKLAWAMALIDGGPSQDEKFFLNNLRDHLFTTSSKELPELEAAIARQLNCPLEDFVSHSRLPESSLADSDSSDEVGTGDEDGAVQEGLDLDACLKELDELVGLTQVKDEVRKLVSFLEIQKKRQEHDLSRINLSLHMVFTGNPGTGKTTVARLVARVYQALGFLRKGHLVETDRSGLIGQYIGHTEVKTNDIIDKALDGILFIDEAYSLYKEGASNDFGQEAIDALVKRMEDDRERLVVIVAGYEEEMQAFINVNPGLRSRFNTYVDFKNYEPDELRDIFTLISGANDYELDEQASKKLKTILADASEKAGRSFGNGRYIRNLFEKILRTQAMRLSKIEADLVRKDLVTITADDIIKSD